LIESLGSEFNFRVIARDRDLGDAQHYPGIRPGEWMRSGKGEVLYLDPGLRGTLRLLWELLRSGTDLIYVNSFFSRRFAMLPSALRYLGLPKGVPLLLAPRGEFSLGALQIKPRRKRWFLRATNAIGLYRYCVWHASSNFEAADIDREIRPRMKSLSVAVERLCPSTLNAMFTAKPLSFVASDMTGGYSDGESPPTVRPKSAGAAEFAFLSRIDRMKNLLGAIVMLKSLRGRVQFHVYGPCTDEPYLSECKAAEAALPSNVNVIWHGGIPHNEVRGYLSHHHFFLLPTWGENYGHVIVEALAAGCPVIISDLTPWRHLEETGVGWALPLESERFAMVLQECVDMEDGRFQDFSARAASFAVDRLRDPKTLADNRKMLAEVIAMGTRPGNK
jgi:glycosyltransferase involved in cell wall biosynthesis